MISRCSGRLVFLTCGTRSKQFPPLLEQLVAKSFFCARGDAGGTAPATAEKSEKKIFQTSSARVSDEGHGFQNLKSSEHGMFRAVFHSG